MASPFPIPRWREVLVDRVAEAVDALLDVDGVADVVVGGSVGRGEPWPFSDIDLVPITSGEDFDKTLLASIKDRLGLQWARTGLATTLDLGSLAFTTDECAEVLGGADLVPKLRDSRWLHGTDKAAGGYGAVDDGIAERFAAITQLSRFDPRVRRERFESWMAIVDRRLARAHAALAEGAVDQALTAAQVAGPLAAAALEAWSEREGSMTKFATRFERIARARGASDVADAIARIARSSVEAVTTTVTELPPWLETRIELAYLGRREVEEPVTAKENRRDHILLFLGVRGLPTLAEWLRGAAPDAAAYVDHSANVALSVRDLI